MRTARCRPLLGLAAAGALTATMAFGAGTASASDADTCTTGSSTTTLECVQQPGQPVVGATGTTPGMGTAPLTVTVPPEAKVVAPQAPAAAQQPAVAGANAAAPNSTAAANPAANDDTYTNVDGDQVERPDSNAAGATALCNDGTYSHSENRSGTCSGHGGVKQFLTGTGTTTASQPTSSGEQFNGQYWDDGQGHHRYGWGWNSARHCWQYAAPTQDDTPVKTSQVTSVPTGGVDTGDGSFGR